MSHPSALLRRRFKTPQRNPNPMSKESIMGKSKKEALERASLKPRNREPRVVIVITRVSPTTFTHRKLFR